MLRTLTVPALLLATTSFAFAAGPHEHGVGNMNVVLDGTALLIELEIPGTDVVGFEHKAKSEDDKAKVVSALASLGAPEALFSLSAGAGCTLQATTLDTDLLADDHGHDDHDHGHDDHDHGHDDHDHGHDDHDHSHEGDEPHGSFRASYDYACGMPGALESIETTLFDTFQSLEKLRVQSVGPKGQSGAELTRDAPVLGL